jgi:hypothetical protein
MRDLLVHLAAWLSRRNPFTKLLLRPRALFASLNWEIARNRARFEDVSRLLPFSPWSDSTVAKGIKRN